MKELVLIRIDDRLIHGQVVTSWVGHTGATEVLIIDDPISKDNFLQRLLKAAAPEGIKVQVLNTEDAISYLLEEQKGQEKIMVLVKTPDYIEAMLDGGIAFSKVILGGMGAKEGRKRFNRNVSASPEELDTLKRIRQRDVEIYYQLVPGQRAEDIQKMI